MKAWWVCGTAHLGVCENLVPSKLGVKLARVSCWLSCDQPKKWGGRGSPLFGDAGHASHRIPGATLEDGGPQGAGGGNGRETVERDSSYDSSISVVQWLQVFFLFFWMAAPLKIWSSQRRVPIHFFQGH